MWRVSGHVLSLATKKRGGEEKKKKKTASPLTSVEIPSMSCLTQTSQNNILKTTFINKFTNLLGYTFVFITIRNKEIIALFLNVQHYH